MRIVDLTYYSSLMPKHDFSEKKTHSEFSKLLAEKLKELNNVNIESDENTSNKNIEELKHALLLMNKLKDENKKECKICGKQTDFGEYCDEHSNIVKSVY